jgi:hypothetical protein
MLVFPFPALQPKLPTIVQTNKDGVRHPVSWTLHCLNSRQLYVMYSVLRVCVCVCVLRVCASTCVRV